MLDIRLHNTKWRGEIYFKSETSDFPQTKSPVWQVSDCLQDQSKAAHSIT